MIKKLTLFLGLFFIMITSTYGASLTSDINTPSLLSDLEDRTYQETSKFTYLVFTNLTFEVKEPLNYRSDSALIYFVSNNNDIAIPFVFQAFYKDSNDDLQAVFQEVDIPASTTSTFFVEPTKDLEYISIYVRCLGENVTEVGFNSSSCGIGYQVRESMLYETEEGVNTVFTPLIAGVVDLIKINVNIWKLGYYVIIGALIVSIVFGFILVGRRIYQASLNAPQLNFGKRKH